MKGDRLKWNERHAAKQGFHLPDTYLVKQLSVLQPHKVLDLACGRGRNAFYLAENGFQVTAVDISEVGLQILAEEAVQRKLNISIAEVDLDEPSALFEMGTFDCIVCLNFKPQHALIQLIPKLLNKNGTFLWCSFNEIQAELSGFPLEMTLLPEAHINHFPTCQLIDYSRFTDESGHRDGYFFLNKSS